MKLFVGRLPKDITKEEVNDYFDEFGDMTDVFVPFKPFRGFAFITYADQEDAMRVLSMTHHLKVNRLFLRKICLAVNFVHGITTYCILSKITCISNDYDDLLIVLCLPIYCLSVYM